MMEETAGATEWVEVEMDLVAVERAVADRDLMVWCAAAEWVEAERDLVVGWAAGETAWAAGARDTATEKPEAAETARG